MDTLSHGLWGGIAFGRTNKKAFWWSFAFGVAPDLLSFGIFTASTLIGVAASPDWSHGPPSMNAIPTYVSQLYNVTHSFVPFAIIFALVWAFRKKPFLPLLAWPLHILVDIPTHSTEFFPTPFLWPFFNNLRVDGIPWSHPWIFVPNVVLLVGLYTWWLWRKKRKKMLQ